MTNTGLISLDGDNERAAVGTAFFARFCACVPRVADPAAGGGGPNDALAPIDPAIHSNERLYPSGLIATPIALAALLKQSMLQMEVPQLERTLFKNDTHCVFLDPICARQS